MSLVLFLRDDKKIAKLFLFFKFSLLLLHRKIVQNEMASREDIIKHTSKMFIEQGIKAVRMDDIAQELSISKRTLYELFGDKEELIYQSIRHYSETSRERRMEEIADLDNSLEVMILNLRGMMDVAPIAGRMRRNMRRFYPSVYNRLEEDVQSKSYNDLENWMDNCVANGYFESHINKERAVKLLHHSVHGMLINTLHEEAPSDKLIEMMYYALLIFIRGLCTEKGKVAFDTYKAKYFDNI